MAREIERKFLVHGQPWQALPQGALLRQGYLTADPAKVVRVRVEGDRATLTVKSGTHGLVRGEWEYPIPLADANDMLQLCERPLIEKYRYRIAHGRHMWELDVFIGDNDGLVVAEIELDSVHEAFERPAWLAAEVTEDERYLNAKLMRQPYSMWKDQVA